MNSFTYIDIGIIVVVMLMGIKGIWQGMIRGLASLLGILFGVIVASRFYNDAGEIFASVIYDFGSVELNALVGFIILLLGVWVVILCIGEVIYKVVKFTPLAFLDGALGFVLSSLKAFLFVSIIVFGISQINWLNNLNQKLSNNSYLYPAMKSVAMAIMNLEQIQQAKQNLQNIELPQIDTKALEDNLNLQEDSKK